MKKVILLTVVILVLIPSQAQDMDRDNSNNEEIRTLFGDRDISHGGYGALSINYSVIDNKDAILMGARGGWVIGHSFVMGFGGYGFINDASYNPAIPVGGKNVNLAGGYGGFFMEPIIFPKFPVHLSFPVLIGAGGIAYATSYNPYEWDETNYFVEEATAFFVLEPGVEIEFNIVKFLRLALGGYYRYTSNISLPYDTPSNALKGFSGGITLKFGKF